MKWCKRWSFLIILAMAGVVYYGAPQGIQWINDWRGMISTGEESPADETVTAGGDAAESSKVGEDPEGNSGDTSGDIAGDISGDISPETPPETGISPEGGEPVPGATPEPEPLPEETPEPTATPEPEIRIGRVEDDYFSDALFLGDSRTVGLYKYGVWGETATFYASTGMTIYKLFGAEIVELPEQPDPISVEEALQHQSFSKIYIMMGINEVGSGTTESFAQAYGEVVARLQELQPDAIIYIQSILKVSQARSDKGDYINNEAIQARNDALSQLADGEKVFYLDVNSALCDENGALFGDYTFDGVHLKAKYITLWEEFLRDNAVLLD